MSSFMEALPVYVITDSRLSLGRRTEDVVQAAIQGGARIFQLREKDFSNEQLLATAHALRNITLACGALLLINDRVDVALEVLADGVHLGQGDMSAQEARNILGPNRIIGISADTPEQARMAEAAGADYVGTGPVYDTTTKADAGPGQGLSLVRTIKAATRIPVLGVGGINAGNARDVAVAGADGIGVVSAIVSQPDVAGAVISLRRAFQGL
jgi:thiamine-phosphate diphosphorylase